MCNLRKMSNCGATTTAMLVILLAFVCSVSAKDDANQLNFSTQECSLTEPVYGYKFDFQGLRSDLAHVVQGTNNDIFEFNVCSNLTHTCNGESNVAACLKKQNKEYVLGHQHELHYSDGSIYLQYLSGAKCENGTGDNDHYTLHVKLSCDYTLDANPMHVTGYAEHACSFYIEYETPLACLPIPDALQSNSCSVRTDTGSSYDLMSLSDNNYLTVNRQGDFLIINICKPVLYGRNAMCPAGSSICMYSPKAADIKKRFINFGNVQSQPILNKDGQVILRHDSPTPCATKPAINYTSIINFSCDRTVMNAHPEFMGTDQDGCTYQFTFSTPLVCTPLIPCTAVTAGNELLDLSPLSKNAPHKLTKDGKTYTLAVCASAGTPCMENGGACYEQNGQTYSLGNFNSHLRFNQSGSPYLLYEDGTKCGSTDRRWSTKIEFVCANNATKDNGSATAATDAVQIIEDSNCQLLIQYQTPYACQQQIKCKVKSYVDGFSDAGFLDLTPLINANENYEADVQLLESSAQQLPKNAKFFLNVCRPLVPTYQLGCAGGSAVCMAKMSDAGAPEEEHSLGFPLVQLTAINQTTAELLYVRGDPCPTVKAMNLSSSIRFSCDMRSGRGRPVLRSIDDCNYHFDWHTSIICPPHDCSVTADTCEIVQDDAGTRFNLRNATFTKDGKIEVDYNNNKISVNLCGLHRKAITDYSQDLVNLFFTHEPGCGKDGTMNVQMRLICSNKTESISTMTNDTQCSLLYEQRTPSICQFLGLKVPPAVDTSTTTSSTTTTTTTSTTTSTTTTTSKGATPTGKPAEATTTAIATEAAVQPAVVISPTASVGTILGIILSVSFFVACVGMFAISPARRQRVRRLFQRSNSAVRYSRVQSNEEANLLLEPNGEFTESDDDMLL